MIIKVIIIVIRELILKDFIKSYIGLKIIIVNDKINLTIDKKDKIIVKDLLQMNI